MGPLAPGGPRPKEILESFEKHRKVYEYPPELIQEPPGITHDLTEPLSLDLPKQGKAPNQEQGHRTPDPGPLITE